MDEWAVEDMPHGADIEAKEASADGAEGGKNCPHAGASMTIAEE